MRLQAIELLGVALISVSLSFIHIGFSIGAVGVYLLAAAIIAQLTEGEGK